MVNLNWVVRYSHEGTEEDNENPDRNFKACDLSATLEQVVRGSSFQLSTLKGVSLQVVYVLRARNILYRFFLSLFCYVFVAVIDGNFNNILLISQTNFFTGIQRQHCKLVWNGSKHWHAPRHSS